LTTTSTFFFSTDFFSGVTDLFVFLSSRSNYSSEFRYEESTGPLGFFSFFSFFISFFCFFGFGVYYSDSDEVYFFACFFDFLSFLGI
jgi:hypothetical protein